MYSDIIGSLEVIGKCIIGKSIRYCLMSISILVLTPLVLMSRSSISLSQCVLSDNMMEEEVDEDNNNYVDIYDESLRNIRYKGKYR